MANIFENAGVYTVPLYKPSFPSDNAANEFSAQFNPYYHLALISDSPSFQVTAITTSNGSTDIFCTYRDSFQIYSAYVTKDFHNYSEDVVRVRHLFKRDMVPFFALYDRNTSGLGQDYLIGLDSNGARRLALVDSYGSYTVFLCDDCIHANFTGATVTSWDTRRKRWVSIVDCSTGARFAVSDNLQDWTEKDWLLNISSCFIDKAIEMFPIADDDDPKYVIWVLVRKSKPDPMGRTTLLYSTFVPDDSDQNYQDMGVLDYSTDWLDFAIVSESRTDYRHRKVVAAKKGEYRSYGIQNNTYLTGRELSYSKGKLRQMPISTVYGPSTWEQEIPSKTYNPDMRNGEDILASAVSAKIEAEFIFSTKGIFGFDLFCHPRMSVIYAASFLIDVNNLKVSLYRHSYSWFQPQVSSYGDLPFPPDPYTEIVHPFDLDASGNVKVLLLLDICIVEYFLYDGLYAGSIFVFPAEDLNVQRINSDVDVELRNIKISIYKRHYSD